VFTSNTGGPLRVTFNSGEVEDGWDELIVLDSDGTTELYNGYGNSGDLSGLVFDSTGDTIIVKITSDTSVNCQDEPFTSWNFTVVCATCVNPTATFTTVPDCTNDEYSINVNVTSLGSATSLSISDGTTTLPNITATGIQTFGPYSSGSSVTIILTNQQDGSCTLSSGSLTYVCPPANDECVNAIPVDCSDVVTGSTANGATDSGNNSSADVWYSYSGEAGDITVSLCTNTSYDSLIRVFDACGGTEIISNDDSCGVQSSVTFTANGTSTYYIMVEGYSSDTGDFEMTVSCVLSNDSFDNTAFKVYPNPVKDMLNLSYNTEISKVQVVNMLGQIVINRNMNATEGQIDMSGLNSGAYIVNVTVGDSVKTIKVIKQ
ncbi:MAG: T9SS type A sorting domain-containing protein, partial [Bacteroidia bacterium]